MIFQIGEKPVLKGNLLVRADKEIYFMLIRRVLKMAGILCDQQRYSKAKSYEERYKELLAQLLEFTEEISVIKKNIDDFELLGDAKKYVVFPHPDDPPHFYKHSD